MATGVSATLAGSGALSLTQASSTYPDITADSDEENDTAFEGTLGGAAACGVDATGLLDVTSVEGGTQSVPVTIPTGRAGPATTHSRTQTLAIPDDDAGGVVSTLFVPISGRIKDLDVRINSIDHSFVGDLKVELVSPDNATTVRLIEHVGGPNNGGDDLVDTVFDDDAPTTIGSGGSAAPYTGSFRPQGDQLGRFNGKEQQGTWKLRVSDRYENDTGSLLSWGLTIRTAQCDPDVNAPDTAIQVAPPSRAGSRTASFEFTASKAGTQFQCRLDGGDFSPCSSPQEFGNLPEGSHTFEVRAFDSKGNVDGSPAVYTWTVDVTAPAPHIANVAGAAPHVQGNAGTASGDDASVTVDLYSGSAASGAPVQSVVASRAESGSFSADFTRVAAGTYTVRAHQKDAAGNDGSSAPLTFAVAGDPPPDFAVVSTEDSLADASAGRLAALSSCEGDCRRSTTLVVSSKTAARLGLPRRSVRLGSGTKRSGAGGVGVKLTRAARAALRRSRGATATVHAVAGSVSLSKAVSLRRSLAPSRIARRGLKLAGRCSAACTINARLLVSAATARRLRLGSRSVAIGAGTTAAAAGQTKTISVRLSRSTRAKVSRARGALVTLEITVHGTGTTTRRATRRITLG